MPDRGKNHVVLSINENYLDKSITENRLLEDTLEQFYDYRHNYLNGNKFNKLDESTL